MDFTYFNPHSQSEPDFLANFVARQDAIDFHLRQLRAVPPGRAARHHLIVAPRGYGKTSLLRRLAIEVRTDAKLREGFIALSFREEQHNVISLDVFWRNCLQSLLEAREDEQAPEAEIEALDQAWTHHAPRQALSREDQDGQPAWREFNDRCRQLRRRPLLLIDNLDALLAGLAPTHQWALRGILQQEDGPALIAAASRYPEATHDPKAAFYDFFRIQTLDKLSDQEVMRCLRTLATHRGPAGRGVLELLNNDPGRVAALNTLAGGNPRTLAVLYNVLESHMSADVLSQLGAMLDTFTGWYQARTEELPMQARAVFDALALHWDPITAAALGATTGLDTAVVSSQLSRLEKSGFIEAVAMNRRGKGRNGYQVSERFFNIWYLMRNGPRRARQSIRFLTVFLQSCFTASERHLIARKMLDESHANPGYALALASSVRHGNLRERLLDHAAGQAQRQGDGEEYGTLIAEMRAPKSGEPRRLPAGTASNEPTLAELDLVIERNRIADDLVSREQVARALFNKGFTLGTLGRSEEAIAVYDAVVGRYGDAPEPALREVVALALVNKGVTLGTLGRSEEAIAVYNALVERYGDAPEAALREQVARALVSKGIALGMLGRSDEEIAIYDALVGKYGDAPEAAVCENVASALVNKGVTLGTLGRSDEEIAVYDALVGQYGDASEAALREKVARALLNKGVALGTLGRSDEEIAVYDTLIARYGNAPEAALREQVARALFNKGVRLGAFGRSDEEIEVYDALVERYGEAHETALREQVARALLNKGVRLGAFGRSKEAIAVYDALVERYGNAPEVALREQVARGQFNKAVRLGALRRSEEAIEVYDALVGRYGDAPEMALREIVARAPFNKGVTLGKLGRFDEEIAAYDALVERYGDAPEAALRELVARALVNKGVTFGTLGRPNEAIAVYDALVERYGDAPEAALREQVASALVNKGVTLGTLGRSEEEIAAYDALVGRYGDAPETALRERVARALLSKGKVFDQRGDSTRALADYVAGLALGPTPENRASLAANCAYMLALHRDAPDLADHHVQQALAEVKWSSVAGRHLLSALTCLLDASTARWECMFEKIGMAISSGDAELWSDYLDDLRRLLWYIIAHGEGASLRLWMEQRDYATQFAPLFHAFVAAIEGEDKLLQINPETREPAMRIYAGIANRIKVYGVGGAKRRR